MICSSLNRFFTSNLLPGGLDSKARCYSKLGGRRKDYKGWIFASPTHETWTQVLFRLRFNFQNPIFQNKRHVRAVQSLLDFLPPETIRSIIVFTGESQFKTETPQGVIPISQLVGYLRAQTEEVMSLNRVQFCVGRLETARLAISGETDVEHIRSLQQRHGGPR